ncbi:TPA: hypothetical protein ACH3X2_006206 [Trebouxia sp. C0005]
MGARAAEIFQPVYHDNDRAYASLYFKFASSQSYQSNARQWLRVPDFQQPIECSCCVWHPQLRGVSESSTDFDRMRQESVSAHMQPAFRQAIMTQIKADQLAALSRRNKYGLGSPPEVVMACLQKRLLTLLQAKNQDLGLDLQESKGTYIPVQGDMLPDMQMLLFEVESADAWLLIQPEILILGL